MKNITTLDFDQAYERQSFMEGEACEWLDLEQIPAIIDTIPTNSIYISIDKDVLARDQAVTAWDQGTMKLNELLELMKAIGSRKNIAGIDICGEYPISPTNAYNREARIAINKNNEANERILDVIKQNNFPS